MAHWPLPGRLGVFYGDDTLLGGLPYIAALEFHGLRSATLMFAAFANGDRDLYDLRRDPDQLVNVAETAPTWIVRALGARTRAMATCVGRACRDLEDAPVPELP